jgi:hypothetical protein
MRIAIGAGVLLSLFFTSTFAGQPRERTTLPSASADNGQRAADRAQRAVIAKEYLAARKSAENTCLNSLASSVRWLATLNAQAEARDLVKEIRDADAKFVGLQQLDKLVTDIAKPAPLEESKKKELASRKLNAQRQKATALVELAGRCYRGELLGYAYDLACDALLADPDNAIVRQAMGQSKSGNAWYSPFDTAALGRGDVYVADVGWVPKAAQTRVAAGEWQENGTWMPIAEANRVHANPANPWIIETDNFILKSTASRKQATFIAEKLEAIRELCFREYLDFFLRGSKKTGGQMLFNKPFPKKLVVNYFGRKADFESSIAVSEIPGENKPLLLRSAGFYSPHVHGSYFYYDPNFGPFQVIVMQHEVTHQILGEYSSGGADFPWLSEGVADVLEAAAPASESNRLVLPHGYDHPDVIKAAAMLKHNTLPSIPNLMTLNRAAFHGEAVRRMNYEVSGALCRFLLEYKDGAYAADFLEYLYDSYQARSTIGIGKYLGMEPAEIETEFRTYLSGCDPDYAKHELAARTPPKSPGDSDSAPSVKKPDPPKTKPGDRSVSQDDNNPFRRNSD